MLWLGKEISDIKIEFLFTGIFFPQNVEGKLRLQ